jgi:hypothetical protein
MSAALGSPARPERPAGDAHPLTGFASADESARLIRHHRYAVERMMRILGGWIALTPELSAKLLMGRHVWDNAQHADALGKRLPELRSLAQVSEPASPAFAAFMDAIEEAERPGQTIERLVGVYRVLKPHLLASYEDELRHVNAVYEPPTERIFQRLAEDERRHIAAGATIIAHLAATPDAAARAATWQAHLEAMLAEAGGVTGRGIPAPADHMAVPTAAAMNDDARQFIRLEQSPTRWPMPDALASALAAFGAALVARDAAGIERWFAPAIENPHGVAALLAGIGADRHDVTAFAKIGIKRLVKIRFAGGRAGADGLALLTRWTPDGDDWRLELVDAPGVDLSQIA